MGRVSRARCCFYALHDEGGGDIRLNGDMRSDQRGNNMCLGKETDLVARVDDDVRSAEELSHRA